MNSFNISTWKYFKISDIFTKIESCKCSNASSLLEEGEDVYYIGAKKSNNGIMRKVKYNSNFITKGNCIIFICDGQGSVGYTNYMDKNFIGSTTLSVGYNDKLNKYNGIFLVTILDKERFKYSYGRKYKQNLNKLNILLPAMYRKDKYEPDWQFMEKFIKEKYDNLEQAYKTKNIKTNINLEVSKWKEFRIGGDKGLFNIKLSKGDLKIKDCLKGNIPLISSGSMNNGNVGFIDEEGDGKAEIFPKDTITVDMFCKAYYQPDNYFAVSHGRVNILIPKFKINKAIGLFIVTIINNEKYRFEYGRAVYSNVISDMIIKLPAIKKDNGEYEPNWKYMEDYIKSLPYGDLI